MVAGKRRVNRRRKQEGGRVDRERARPAPDANEALAHDKRAGGGEGGEEADPRGALAIRVCRWEEPDDSERNEQEEGTKPAESDRERVDDSLPARQPVDRREELLIHLQSLTPPLTFELPKEQEPSRMPPMRRVAAAIAVSAALVGSAALPALAERCCAPSHACCAKGGEDRGVALERAPGFKVAAAAKHAAREQVPPRGSVIAIAAVPAPSSHPAVLTARAPAPASMQTPVSPPHPSPLPPRVQTDLLRK